MADKEISISHDLIRDPQTITDKVSKAFKEKGVDIHRNDCVELVDDFPEKRRVYKVRARKFFGPWSHRG